MSEHRRAKPTPPETPRPAGPGRPKDLGKRAAILDAAKRLFLVQGFTGVSMDQIAAEAGVSKLTVYSHFGDKESLFADAESTEIPVGAGEKFAAVGEIELRRPGDVPAQSRRAGTAAAAALQPDGAVQGDVTTEGLRAGSVAERRERRQKAKRRQ